MMEDKVPRTQSPHRSPEDRDPEGQATRGPPARRSRLGLVPADYAEKTMSSLMSLHEDLMAEKERALEATRRLMSVQQDRAELESYVRLLEAELHRRGGPALAEVRTSGNGGLDSAAEKVLRSLATPQPPAAVPQTPPAVVASATPPAPSVPVPAEGQGPAAISDPPRPPRPSATYRAPFAPVGQGAGSSEVEDPEDQRGEAEVGSAVPEAPEVNGEGWRQW